MSSVLSERRAYVSERLAALRAQLASAEALVRDNACVYLTGSVARGEATKHSDLDLFIVGQTKGDDERKLSRLDEILLKAELIQATRACGFPAFSGDGEWLEHYTVSQLVRTLGRAEDDVTNTFTARLLLLLESTPLLGNDVYRQAIDDVIVTYWRDFERHAEEFVPAFLANDILRLWRTFCVNYEARTRLDPPEQRAKRKLKNYKLKHSRLLTCFSALAYLLFVSKLEKTVTPAHARHMTQLSPTERLQWVGQRSGHADEVRSVLEGYERFLDKTDAPEHELVAQFLDPEQARGFSGHSNELGDAMSKLLAAVGQGTRLYRLLVV